LYFINDLDNEMEAVSVAPGPVLQVGLPQRLFSTREFADYHLAAFDVAPDGRFIALKEIRTGPRHADELVVV
jgi:hypothetical protein